MSSLYNEVYLQIIVVIHVAWSPVASDTTRGRSRRHLKNYLGRKFLLTLGIDVASESREVRHKSSENRILCEKNHTGGVSTYCN